MKVVAYVTGRAHDIVPAASPVALFMGKGNLSAYHGEPVDVTPTERMELWLTHIQGSPSLLAEMDQRIGRNNALFSACALGCLVSTTMGILSLFGFHSSDFPNFSMLVNSHARALAYGFLPLPFLMTAMVWTIRRMTVSSDGLYMRTWWSSRIQKQVQCLRKCGVVIPPQLDALQEALSRCEHLSALEAGMLLSNGPVDCVGMMRLKERIDSVCVRAEASWKLKGVATPSELVLNGNTSELLARVMEALPAIPPDDIMGVAIV